MAHGSGKRKYSAIKAKPGEPAHPGRGTGAENVLADSAGLKIIRDSFTNPITLKTKIPGTSRTPRNPNGAQIASNLDPREEGPGY